MAEMWLRARLDSVFKASGDLDCILIANTGQQDPNFTYMADFSSGLFESSILLLERKKATLFTYRLEYETALRQAQKGMSVVNLNSKAKFEELKKKVSGRKMGANLGFLPYLTYINIKKKLKPKRVVDVSKAFEKAREIKSKPEIDRIRKAARITKEAISESHKHLKEGMTEKELAAIFEFHALKLGCDGLSFSTIVCFGANAALPHHSPDNTKLKKGDFVLMDVGVKVRNYCSDITRTIIFGRDSRYAEKMRVLETVLSAQKNAIAAIKKGASGSSIHSIAQSYIDTAYGGKYKGTFIHALGHSIGIDVHDGSRGFLSPRSNLKLQSGMITSVEPGIYIPSFGGARVEDDILVTDKGAIIL